MDNKNSLNNYNVTNLSIDILKIKHADLSNEWKADNVCSSFSRIYVPTDGEGWIFYSGKKIKLVKGNVYIVPSSLTFSYGCENFLQKFYIHVVIRKPDGMDALSKINECLILPRQDASKKIEKLLLNNGLESAIGIQSLLFQLVFDAISNYNIELEKNNRYPKVLEKAICYINANLRASLTIDEIASNLFISRSALQKLFKEHLNIPLGKYVDDRILAESERLLLCSDLSIREISDKLSFCDQFYFSRKFTAYYGVPPIKHRQRNI